MGKGSGGYYKMSKLRTNINKSVEILKRYRKTAIERDKKEAKVNIEIVMQTVEDLCKLSFDNINAVKDMIEKMYIKNELKDLTNTQYNDGYNIAIDDVLCKLNME